MKSTLKVFGMAAAAALAGLALASCLSLGSGGNDNGNGGAYGAGGAMAPAEWPEQGVWERYGIAGGLQQPPGTAVAMVHSQTYAGVTVFTVTLENANMATFDSLANQLEKKDGWSLSKRESSRREETVSFARGGSSVVFALDIRENGVAIMATPDSGQ